MSSLSLDRGRSVDWLNFSLFLCRIDLSPLQGKWVPRPVAIPEHFSVPDLKDIKHQDLRFTIHMDEIAELIEKLTSQLQAFFKDISEGPSVRDQILAFVHAVDWTVRSRSSSFCCEGTAWQFSYCYLQHSFPCGDAGTMDYWSPGFSSPPPHHSATHAAE